MPARIMLANGMVIDLVGYVRLDKNFEPVILYGGALAIDCSSRARLRIEIDSFDFTIYQRAEDAPEHNSKLRALTSGADRLPLERVDGEILPED